jgi:predicted ATPase/class 3 adenylate cyclase/DNA-binding CsgD family transcriptional regulator
MSGLQVSPPAGHTAPALPIGTVTFLLTDVEGSVRLWEQHPSQMRAVLSRHDVLFETLAQAHGGTMVRPRGEGDSRFCVFARATDAVAAAIAMQQGLHAEPCQAEIRLRVRMALHTGEADLRDGDYYGSAVNRCARLRAIAYGGQVLLSKATTDLVQDSLPEGATLRDMGDHSLRGLSRLERVFQLVIRGLAADFPPLRTLETLPHNLPLAVTPFVGRERELEGIGHQLRRPEVRLLTLTGPGGTGKTRLAVAAAADLLGDFSGGVTFVALESLSDPALVVPAVAQALRVREASDRPLAQTVEEYLRLQHLLLVLDNFEQVLPAAPFVASLLAACPGLKVLVTSRIVLRLRGEYSYPVPPLALPSFDDLARLEQAATLERLGRFEAVRLFVERAQAAQPSFALTGENAPAVTQLCLRLDGLPLAIELAAARVRLLPPESLLARLHGSSGRTPLELLTSGLRDLPTRQQTLRQAIGWSYDLLSSEEQTLFRCLSVFAGGFTLEAAETVCGDDERQTDVGTVGSIRPSSSVFRPADILDRLQSLVENSLVREEPGSKGEPRFRFLETIREYAAERLESDGDAAAIRQRHAGYYLTLAEAAAPALRGPHQREWMERLEVEHANLHIALDWLLTKGDPEPVGRLVRALWWFWSLRGLLSEGRAALERAIALSPAAPALGDGLQGRSGSRATGGTDEGRRTKDEGDNPHVTGAPGTRDRSTGGWAEMLCGAGALAFQQGDYTTARSLLEQSVAAGLAAGELQSVSHALGWLALSALHHDQRERARSIALESVALSRQAGDRWALALALNWLGHTCLHLPDLEAAQAAYAESSGLFRQTGDGWGVALALSGLANTAFQRGDYTSASALHEEAAALRRAVGDRWFLSFSLVSLGDVAHALGDNSRAASFCAESLSLFRDLGSTWGIAVSLTTLGQIAVAAGHAGHSVPLFGAAEALLQAASAHLDPADRPPYERAVEAARAALSERDFTAAWARGQAMSLDEAISTGLEVHDLVQSTVPTDASSTSAENAASAGTGTKRSPLALSRRELEVAALIAQGRTNREIADALVISQRTAETHVDHILTKLGFGSRAQVAAWAVEQGVGASGASRARSK